MPGVTSPSVPLLVVGFIGQALFAARALWQWIASERAGRCLVPRGYWYLSLVAAGFVLVYAFSRDNLVYVLSVVPGAFVAFRNLRLHRSAGRGELVPWAVVLIGLISWSVLARPRLGPTLWAVIGLLGSALWAGRFVVQWWISERRGESTLPRPFWIQSLIGGLLLLAYALHERDPVMIAGYAFVCVPQVRNLFLLRSVSPPSSA